MSKKASSEFLHELHELLARELTSQIKQGVTKIDSKTGKTVKQKASPALLSVARQFLSDNKIVRDKNHESMSALEQALADVDLPFDEPDSDTQH